METHSLVVRTRSKSSMFQAVEKDSECFENLSMNGNFSIISAILRSS